MVQTVSTCGKSLKESQEIESGVLVYGNESLFFCETASVCLMLSRQLCHEERL